MAKTETAIFAAGCFWGVQDYFDKVPGILETIVGYTGGHVNNPTYEAVCTHTTGHAEAIQLHFDPSVVSYEALLKHFFYMHDPTQINRQGPDVGDNYRSAIFYTSESQAASAQQAIAALTTARKFATPIATEVTAAEEFYPAEEFHQKFVQKNGYGACHVAPPTRLA